MEDDLPDFLVGFLAVFGHDQGQPFPFVQTFAEGACVALGAFSLFFDCFPLFGVWLEEAAGGLENPQAFAVLHPLGDLSPLADVFEQVVKIVVFDPLDVGSSVAPEVSEQLSRHKSTGQPDAVEVGPAFFVVVKFDLGAVFRVDLVELAFPFDALAQLVEDFADSVTGNIEGL